MFPRQTGVGCPKRYQHSRSAMGGHGQCLEQCMEQCCNPQYGSTPWTMEPTNYQGIHYRPPSGSGSLNQQMRQYGASRGQFQPISASSPYNELSGPMGSQAVTPYSSLRAPSLRKYPGGDTKADLRSGQNKGGDWSRLTEMSLNDSDEVENPSWGTWPMMTGGTPFSSSGGYLNSGWSNQSSLGNNSRRPAPGCPNPQVHQGYSHDCTLNHQNNDSPSLLSRLMNKIRPPSPECPLVPQTPKVSKASGGMGQGNSCFRSMGSSKNQGDAFESLDDLWNPRKIRRWGCVNNWDHHKESQWKQVIENKLCNCGPAGRSVEIKVREAMDALQQEGAECIAFRMFYGILKRNEDVYLNPYIKLMTDEEFLKLIVALNNFYFEDKDKAKLFLDHPPPTLIEKVMQKESLVILDPNSRAPSIVRRFWELLLDWYVQKLVDKGDPSASCETSKTASQSSVGSLC